MDDKKCVELLNLGIAEKRNGNFEKALSYYGKAKEYNPFNSNIYYNSGKLLCGIGKYDEAMRNFLTHAHFTITNDAIFSNPFNLLPIEDTLKRIGKSNLNLPSNYSFPSNWLERLANDDRLLMLLADINLTYYTGFAFLANKKMFLDFYSITDSQIKDLQNGLLGKQSNVYLKNPKYEIILICFGLVFLLENLALNSISKDSIPYFYFSNQYRIKNPVSENKIDFEDFLDRNPNDKELDNFLAQLQKNIKKELSLNSVYMGYNLIKDTMFDNSEYFDPLSGCLIVGHTSTLGFEIDMIKNNLKSNNVYLCYFALPIDDDDYLIEKEDMLDWEFEEFLRDKFQTIIVSIGAVAKNEHKRCRTFKFLYAKQ